MQMEYHLSIKSIRKGSLFCQKWYITGIGLGGGASPYKIVGYPPPPPYPFELKLHYADDKAAKPKLNSLSSRLGTRVRWAPGECNLSYATHITEVLQSHMKNSSGKNLFVRKISWNNSPEDEWDYKNYENHAELLSVLFSFYKCLNFISVS